MLGMGFWLLIWLAVAVLAGLCLVIFVPWTAARIAGPEWQEWVSDIYVWLAMTAGTKLAIVARPGTLELVRKKFDSDIKADKDTKHGDARHHHDNFGVLSRLKNKSFGIAIDSRNEYVDPLLAEIGAKTKEKLERDEIGPNKEKQQMFDGIPIAKTSELVDITDAKHLASGACEPEWGQESYEMTKISQEKFNEKVSFGQIMTIMLAAIASMVTMWFLTGQDSPDASTGTTVSTLLLMASVTGRKLNKRELAAAGFVGIWLLIPVLAMMQIGIVGGILVGFVMLSVAAAIPGFVALMGPSLPGFMGMIFCSVFWILAQLAVGRGVIVRRATGEYEHHALRDAPKDSEHDYLCVLDDGKELEINGSNGDLFRFAWAPLGITAEKDEQNMAPITETLPEKAIADGGHIQTASSRQGWNPVLKAPEEDEWLVTLPQLATWCQQSAESEAIEHGRDKALTEHGGKQQIGMIALTIGMVMAILVGGLMGFLAGGGI